MNFEDFNYFNDAAREPENAIVDDGRRERSPRDASPRGKYWLITYFPTGDADGYWNPTPRTDSENLVYLRCNPERCPDTGLFHWQICAVTNERVRIRGIQRMLGIGDAHCEIARSPEAVKTYCSKPETRDLGVEAITFGVFPEGPIRGRRSDLSNAVDHIRNGATIQEVAIQHSDTYVRNFRGLERYYHHSRSVDRIEKPSVEIHWGVTGSGKTRQVYDRFDIADIYNKDPHTAWWDGYDGQRVVLIDDYAGTQGEAGRNCLSYQALLRLCDRYPLRVEIKGGYVSISNSTKFIIFTSNYDPQTWFGYNQDMSAFNRRVDRVVHYTNQFIN